MDEAGVAADVAADFGAAADEAAGGAGGVDFGAAAAVELLALGVVIAFELDAAAPVSDFLLFDFLDFVPASAVVLPLGAVAAFPAAGAFVAALESAFFPFFDFLPDVESAAADEVPAAEEAGLPVLAASLDFFLDFLVGLAALLAELSAAAASAFFAFFDFLVVVVDEL